ncbi:MAG: TonB-dependent receptor [Ginsengibacter sp.]
MKLTLLSLLLLCVTQDRANGQSASITGEITSGGKPVVMASIDLGGLSATLSDSAGIYAFNHIAEGNYLLSASCIGFDVFKKQVSVQAGEQLLLNISLSAAASMLNEVVITGVSRKTFLLESPVSIIAISTKKIEKGHQSNIIDVLVKNAPGLNAMKTGPNISKPFIRGLGYNRVLTLYDGIRQEGQQWGDEHGLEVDDYNISRAEVIKGPASLMYGSDALAGVVSLFPFIPDNEDGKFHGKLIGEYQSNNNLIGNGLRLDYSNRNFLFALHSSYRLSKNYRNAIDGRIYNTNYDVKNLSALIGFKNDKGYSHLNFTVYDNVQGIPDGSRDSLTRKFTRQILEGDDDNIKDRPFVSHAELNSYKPSPLHQHIQHYRLYSHNFYQVGNGEIDVIVALQQNIRREFNHPTMPEQAGMYVRLNTLNYGLRYNAPKFAKIETSIGINGMFQNNKSMDATDFPIPDYHLRDGGLYVNGKWKNNNWSMSGGIRYDLRQVKWNNFYVGINPKTGFDVHVLASANEADLQFSAYKKTFHGLSGSAGFTFQPTKQITFKANIGQGYRSPNITEMAANGLDPGAHIIYLGNRNFTPEFSMQEDIGVSARFKNFSTDISLFNNNIKNYIYLTMLANENGLPIMDSQGNKTYQYQQASAQLYGMETSFSLHPQKWSGFNFDNSMAVVYGFNRKSIYKGKGNNGLYLPLIPPFKLLSSIEQAINLKSKIYSSIIPRVELEFSAKQNRYFGLKDTETVTEGYALFNTGIAFEIKYSQSNSIEFQFQVNNLFDKVYQSNLNRLKYFEYYTESTNARSGIYNMGRNVCLKLLFPF